MRVLDRKLVRDLWRLRGQVVAIATIVAAGVAVLVMSLSTLEALYESANAYYERFRMADVFAHLERAPLHLIERIETLPGVQVVEPRIVRFAPLDIARFDEPVIGQLVSLPSGTQPMLNRLVLRSGRLPDPDRYHEVILNEPFAEAHDPGERVVTAGEPLLQIGDPTQLEIVVDLLSIDAVRVEPGQRVLIERWGGSESIEGRVQRIEPFGYTKISALGIEEQRVNVIIDITSRRELWQRLGHGYQVEARIVMWESDYALTVPLTALFRDGRDWAVFVEQRRRAELRHVRIGRRNRLVGEIVDGLHVGDRVISHPSDRIHIGARIVARD